jgi:hypothetical protein
MAQPQDGRQRRIGKPTYERAAAMGTRSRVLALLAAMSLAATACGGTEGTPRAQNRPAKTTPSKTTSAAPFEGEELTDGEVVAADKLDGVSLQSPDDGRLRNYGAAIEVLDFGTADVVDVGTEQQYGAVEDSTLLAFRLRVTPFAEDAAEKVTATVSVDGRQRSLPNFEYTLEDGSEDTTVQYLVAVPDDRREVELELKYADLAQTFDLLEGERTGDEPEILYRSSDSPSVYVENLTPSQFAVTDEEGEAGTYAMAVRRAELTYFTATLCDVPSGKDKAWLVVTYEPTGDGSLEYAPDAADCTVPFAAFTLTGDGGTYPVVDKHSAMDDSATEKVLVFEVPADLGDAVLTAAPTSFTCDDAGTKYSFAVSGQAKVNITLPED